MQGPGVPADLARRPLYEISLSALLFGTCYRGDFEERLTRTIERLRNDAAIAFIDEVHTLIGMGNNREGAMDAANMIKPAVARGEITLIGATTTEELAVLRYGALPSGACA